MSNEKQPPRDVPRPDDKLDALRKRRRYHRTFGRWPNYGEDWEAHLAVADVMES
jgi:hypothetical protein